VRCPLSLTERCLIPMGRFFIKWKLRKMTLEINMTICVDANIFAEQLFAVFILCKWHCRLTKNLYITTKYCFVHRIVPVFFIA